jgi:hypothetical protein
MKHIAIFVGDAIEKILSGKKTMESRFSAHKVIPYGEISKDDLILLKKSGGDIVGQVIVDNVLCYDNLKPESISVLHKEYSKELNVNDIFWQKKVKSKYATLIFLKKPQRYVTALKYKKKDRRPWVIIKKDGSKVDA